LDPDAKQMLEDPFVNKEIEEVNDKSHGPHGFNNEFIKSCWHIIS
jgi:hypothetical protein